LLHRAVCAAVLLLSSTVLRATVFDFSYSGPLIFDTVSVTGIINATATGGGNYNITTLSGQRNGVSISDASLTNKGSFNADFEIGSFGFLVQGHGVDTVTLYGLGLFSESGGIPSPTAGFNFSIVDPPPPSAPEAATLSLLFTMGLGVWVLARKLPAKKAR
jgi:hypothetical protein